ncbi:MAG: di-trans,poly-cis-decaprenylcistransferase [Clostridiales bacterium]|nr:di-trans,poly-cis-decaprenylcistransferase [Clostridiales bacterium]
MIDTNNLPNHIALIMDGNRTWAKNKGLDPMKGHLKLVIALDKIIKHAVKLGINEVTFYAFSTENWKRSKEEVNWLMKIYNDFISSFTSNYSDIKFTQLGTKEELPEFLRKTIIKVEEETYNCNKMKFNMALNYGGRQEILNATKNIINKVINNEINVDEINEQIFSKELFTSTDVDLMIRTSGQIRVSNYLPWQLSYAEMYFTNCYWPDFNEDELEKAIEEYQRRNRKFGGK